MVDLASSRLVQKRWKAIPRNVAPRKRMVTTVNIMALPLLHEPGDTAERDETGQEKEASGDDRANGQDDLEDRPDDERQAENALEEPAQAHEGRRRALVHAFRQQRTRALELGEKEVRAAAVAIRAGLPAQRLLGRPDVVGERPG